MLGWPGLIGLDEREQQLRRARLARGGAVDQLLDRRLKLGDPPAPAVLIDRDPFAKAAATIVLRLRAPFGRPRGLPDWPGRKRVIIGGRP